MTAPRVNPEPQYRDVHDNPVSLDELCRKEPAWAASRIRVMRREQLESRANPETSDGWAVRVLDQVEFGWSMRQVEREIEPHIAELYDKHGDEYPYWGETPEAARLVAAELAFPYLSALAQEKVGPRPVPASPARAEPAGGTVAAELAQLRELHEHLALMVRYFEAEAREGDGIAEVHFDGYQAAKALLARTAVDQPQWENAQIEISELLREAASPARAEPAGGWLPFDLTDDDCPDIDEGEAAWIVWEGVVQEVPYTWGTDDRGTLGWNVIGMHDAVTEGVTHYQPLVVPAPPPPQSQHPGEVKS